MKRLFKVLIPSMKNDFEFVVLIYNFRLSVTIKNANVNVIEYDVLMVIPILKGNVVRIYNSPRCCNRDKYLKVSLGNWEDKVFG